jgi:hypothetical protein
MMKLLALAPILIVSALSILGTVQVQATTVTTPNFTFNYPDGWIVQKEANRFNHYTTNLNPSGFQVATLSIGGVAYDEITDAQIIERLDKVTSSSVEKTNPNIKSEPFESGIDKYIVGNRTAPYVIHLEKCISSYLSCTNQVHMSAIVTLERNERIMFQYIAEEDIFDKYLSQVEAVLKSIRPTNGAPT